MIPGAWATQATRAPGTWEVVSDDTQARARQTLSNLPGVLVAGVDHGTDFEIVYPFVGP